MPADQNMHLVSELGGGLSDGYRRRRRPTTFVLNALAVAGGGVSAEPTPLSL